jgi:hypothetical protein
MNPKAYRLPAYVLPTEYTIELEARLGSDDFKGSVEIELDVRESRDTIELHSRDLRLSPLERPTPGGRANYEGRS